ncbi:hypothetical protein [Citrobacter amalonaticus]
MTTITKEWLQQTIADMESTRDDIPFGFDVDGNNMLTALKMALASLEAEQRRNPVLAYADSYRDMAKQGVESIPVWSVITDLERNIAPLYSVPPAPVVLPSFDEWLTSTGRKPVAWVREVMEESYNACRAAMLQGSQPVSNRDELPPDEIECDICGHVSTDPEGRHYCCEDNSND